MLAILKPIIIVLDVFEEYFENYCHRRLKNNNKIIIINEFKTQ